MPTETYDRGRVALAVLNNPDFKLLAQYVEQDVFAQWVKTNVADTKVREDLHSVINGLHTLIKKAQTYTAGADFEENKRDHAPDA